MVYPLHERQRVYLSYRAIFTGQNAKIKQKAVRPLVDKHAKTFRKMHREIGLEKVVNILKDLLQKEVFESDRRAREVFPEVFLSSRAKNTERAASENDAARSEAETLRALESGGEDVGAGCSYSHDNGGAVEVNDVAELSVPVDSATNVNEPKLPSLYPSYIPYKAQHLILTTAQRILEESCFEFAEKWLPTLLEERRWDCPEAGELNEWAYILRSRIGKVPAHAMDRQSDEHFRETLQAITRLKHTAVHRMPMTAKGINQLIQSAMNMAEALRDGPRANQFEDLHTEIESKIKSMELNKNDLEEKTATEVQQVRRQIEELRQKEKELVAKMVKDDEENKSLIGILLEEFIPRMFEPPPDLPSLRRDDGGEDSGEKSDSNVKEDVACDTKSPVDGHIPERACGEKSDSYVKEEIAWDMENPEKPEVRKMELEDKSDSYVKEDDAWDTKEPVYVSEEPSDLVDTAPLKKQEPEYYEDGKAEDL
ncbi:hypothetical protein BDY21DRAFT_382199 [Lineolata rhizophorae]|uniref:Ubiquinol-cytochrome-c reductase cytochrome c1 n=1 Tax=Lineolata rhizophorae TaxID=578093 RepID=A0A6A6NNK9_9PEZI|nr:hypothetical protein BDY21DRAFT_382199 [Lineolata rhizophorae]